MELTRVDVGARMICQEFVPRNHIRIRLHKDEDGLIVCTGDKHPARYPPAWFRGIVCQVAGKPIFVIDPRYSLLRENEEIKAATVKHAARHMDFTRRLEAWLLQHAEPGMRES